MAILHAYSADNLGDGLLVQETMRLTESALGADAEVTIAAVRPETFGGVRARVVSSRPTSVREAREYLRLLRTLDEYDAVVGVGGGYLRFGTPAETVKTAFAHLPQLFAAARVGGSAVYLPQSIGPAGAVSRRVAHGRLKRLNRVYLRDDRSVQEFGTRRSTRIRDLALMRPREPHVAGEVNSTCVLSVRPVHGAVPAPVRRLAEMLGTFDGYVQSATGSNQDLGAMQSVRPARILTREELLSPTNERRVVIAIRLHAALMAIAAGHYVIHLAYERKGFGAFDDLGLPEFVHRVSAFDPDVVHAQVRAFLDDPDTRKRYVDQVNAAFLSSTRDEQAVIASIRHAAGSGAFVA